MRAAIVLFALMVPFFSGCSHLMRPSDMTPAEGMRNVRVKSLQGTRPNLPDKGSFWWDFGYTKLAYTADIDLVAVHNRIRKAVQREMKKKGFRLSDEAPDFLVGYAIILEGEVDNAELNENYDADVKWPSDDPAEQDQVYHKGALILDMIDVNTSLPFWRAAYQAEVTLDVSDKEKNRRTASAVRLLLSNFPPQ